MRIVEALATKPQGPELAFQLNRIKEIAVAKLDHIRDLFPLYTDHSRRHIEGVVEILDWLVPDEVKQDLNQWELYFLVAAAYLHDLGMLEACPGPPNGKEWEAELDRSRSKLESGGASNAEIRKHALAAFIRDHHHERSEEYIREHGVELGLTASGNPFEADVVGRVSLGHRKVNLSASGLFTPFTFGNAVINRELLAGYLRLADELDTTARRTPVAEYEVLNITDQRSRLEWGKHLKVSGVAPDPRDGRTILLTGSCDDPDVYLRLQELETEIQGKLDELRQDIRPHFPIGGGRYLPDPIPYYRIAVAVEKRGFESVDIGFTLNENEVIKLILGERLYGDRSACIRELLQNAVDACKASVETREPSYAPEIVVQESPNRRVISVSDNGMGMTRHIIREYFARVGVSYYRSSEFRGQFRPISQFGIGFLSCFMIADRIEVETKSRDEDSALLEITSPTRPFVLRKGTREEIGTEVRLYLKEGIEDEIDVLARAEHFARYIRVPLLGVNHLGERRLLSAIDITLSEGLLRELMDDTDDDPDDSEEQVSAKSLEDYFATAEANGIRVGVLLLDRVAGDRFVRYVRGRRSGGGFVYQDGFYVNDVLGEPLDQVEATVIVDLGGDQRVELTTDRSRYIDKAGVDWRDVYEVYSAAIERLYDRLVAKERAPNWWRFHCKYYHRWRSFSPQALVRATHDNARVCTWTSQGFASKSLDEVASWDGQLYVISPQGHEDLEWFSKLVDESACVMILPPDVEDRAVDWFWKIARVPNAQSFSVLLHKIGASIENVLGLDLLTVGRAIGPWGLKLTWHQTSNYPDRSSGWEDQWFVGIFDAIHPISDEIKQLANGEKASVLRLLIEQFIQQIENYGSTQFDQIVKEFVKAIRELSLPERAATLGTFDNDGVGKHRCPYNHV